MSQDNEKDPNTLEVSVHDEMPLGEQHPGGATKPAPEKTAEEMDAEREAIMLQIMERKIFLSEKYVAPHKKPSRRVKEEDLARVIEDAKIMHEMCMVGRGEYTTAFAIAHSQINDQDPLRFFVTYRGEIFVNPVIVDKTHEIHQTQEGCMSYPEEPMKTVTRFKTVTVKYRTVAHKVSAESGEQLEDPYLTKELTSKFSGDFAQIMQHECQHLNGWDIYRDGTGALKAFGEPGKAI